MSARNPNPRTAAVDPRGPANGGDEDNDFFAEDPALREFLRGYEERVGGINDLMVQAEDILADVAQAE